MSTTIGPIDTNFRTALRRVDAAGQLMKFQTPVSLDYEMAALIRKLQGDKAMYFQDVPGSSMPVAANLLVSAKNCEAVFQQDALGIRACMERAITHPIPPQLVESGPCQEVVVTENIDLGKLLPVLLHAPGDAGRYITSGVVIVKDPVTGVHNASYHRLQLHGGNRTGIQIDVGRHLGVAFENARQLGQPLEIAVALGPDVSIFYAAAFMGAQMPLDSDELSAAGGLRGQALPVVKCKTVDCVVPAETEIVLEGTLRHDEWQHEGPFGEFVEHFSEAGDAPVFRVSAVTMRRKPIYYAMNGAALEMTMLRKYVMEASAYKALKAAVPIVQDVEMTAGGLHRFHIVVQVKKSRPQDEGFQRNAMIAAFATLKDLDLAIAVDEDIDLRDPKDVEYALATRFEASQDIILIPGARGHEYVRASKGGIRTKMGLDCTVPFEQKERFARVQFAAVDLSRHRLTTEPADGSLHAAFGPVKAPAGVR